MIDNIISSPCYFIDKRRPLLIHGSDARSFLNRLLTVNVLSIPDRMGSPAHLLDSTGRLKASLYLLNLDDDQWVAIPYTLSAQELYNSLDMFLFGEQLSFSVKHDYLGLRALLPPSAHGDVLSLLKGTPSDAPPKQGWQLLSLDEGGSFVMSSERWTRNQSLVELELWGPRLSVNNAAKRLEAEGFTDLTEQQEDAIRLSFGAPGRPEYLPRYTPLDIEGSSSLISISEGKGCYPGQEVIERTLALGQPARVLLHLQLTSQADVDPYIELKQLDEGAGIPLFAEGALGQELGLLTSVSPAGYGQRYGLALMKRKHKDTPRFVSASGAQFCLSGASYE